ncbi:MAG: SMI1/KNR4 family protein [Planctomycetes bacterium]|nr:SMI1/KNR4 family protein [Planctomycetota bacterium]
MIFHADTPVADLTAALFATADESVASDAIFRLSVRAKKGESDALATLARYVASGSLGRQRAYACYYLVHTLGKGNADFAELFRTGFGDADIRFWCILGYLHAAGRSAYGELVRLAEDASMPLEHRAFAIRCLSRFAKQPFDRNLSDPSRWSETDLRLSEVRAWSETGCPDGEPPRLVRHAALDKPATAFERIVSRLDQKARKRRKGRGQDSPSTSGFAPAASSDLERIAARWKLPDVYADFLARFSPVDVVLQARRLPRGVHLFGAHELIDCQNGFACSPIDGQALGDWPAPMLVVASHDGAPFVLDLAKCKAGDAPVFVGKRREEGWKFSRAANSFAEFLEELAR